MTTFDIHRMTLSQLKRNLEAKNLSSREITESFLKRISETNKSLNAFITITEEQAVSESVEADEIIANGKANVCLPKPSGKNPREVNMETLIHGAKNFPLQT